MIKKYSRDERKKRRNEENRFFILEAAEKVFAQKGYSLTTVDDIAAEAQFSKATLYRYFKGKRDIFFDVILNSFDEVIMEAKNVRLKEANAGEKLRELITILLQGFLKKPQSLLFCNPRSILSTINAVFLLFIFSPKNTLYKALGHSNNE